MIDIELNDVRNPRFCVKQFHGGLVQLMIRTCVSQSERVSIVIRIIDQAQHSTLIGDVAFTDIHFILFTTNIHYVLSFTL